MNPGHKSSLIEQCANLIWDTKYANEIPVFMQRLGIEKQSTANPYANKRTYVTDTLYNNDDRTVLNFSNNLLVHLKLGNHSSKSKEIETWYKCRSDLERILLEIRNCPSNTVGLKQIFYACQYKPELITQADGFMADKKNCSLDYRGPFSHTGITWDNVLDYFMSKEITLWDLSDRYDKAIAPRCEKLFYEAYTKQFINTGFEISNCEIALLPQVYVNWDPYTKEQRGYKLVNQRVDFLWYGPNHFPLIIEIDGPSHWEFPDEYCVQCRTDRDLMDLGFHIRRFTNDEILSWHNHGELEKEVKSLFSGYLLQAKNKSLT